MGREAVLAAVAGERAVQDFLWGPEHDAQHAFNDWARLIQERTEKLANLTFGIAAVGSDHATVALGRRYLIEVAALAIAALESGAEPAG